jgi:hypothetical protein
MKDNMEQYVQRTVRQESAGIHLIPVILWLDIVLEDVEMGGKEQIVLRVCLLQ